uniref:Uncharacterized protein n=1 Tax=Rhizophagus irregularis (strain DAOM 181602 / DAOM 197198 / MUCL 43194) TaxID=747089 RepID=U9UJV5_RHIID
MPNSTEMYYNSHQTPHNTYNEDYINEIVVQLNSSLDSNGKLEVEARKLRDELDKYKIMCDKYNEKYVELLTKNNEETNQRDVAIRNLKSEIKEREQRLKDVQRLENRVQHLEKEKEELEVKNNNLVQRNGNLETQLEDLTKQNALLEDEASMEVANLDDKDEVVNSYVDLCFFPLIGRDIDSNNRKIYTLAKVIAKPTSNLRASTRQQRNY